VFTHPEAKRAALVTEIARVHAAGRPVLVGTASVGESEELAAALVAAGVPCEVLNARNDEREAAIVARAGEPGAVTISTNMAGRGTDIRLGGREAST
jgi:preprotein translocase subunit SecA